MTEHSDTDSQPEPLGVTMRGLLGAVAQGVPGGSGPLITDDGWLAYCNLTDDLGALEPDFELIFLSIGLRRVEVELEHRRDPRVTQVRELKAAIHELIEARNQVRVAQLLAEGQDPVGMSP